MACALHLVAGSRLHGLAAGTFFVRFDATLQRLGRRRFLSDRERAAHDPDTQRESPNSVSMHEWQFGKSHTRFSERLD